MSLLEKLEIPTLQKQRIPVKTLIEQLQPTPENKRLIESHVGSIYLVSLLNQQTIHYRPYKDDDYSYQAIYVLQITLKKPDQLTDVSIQLHSAFPEPTLLLLDYGEKVGKGVLVGKYYRLAEERAAFRTSDIKRVAVFCKVG